MVHTFIYNGDQNRDFIRSLGVRFEVPLREQAYNRHVAFATHDGGVWSESVQPLNGRRILLAEDVAVNAEIMLMILKMRDMQADHAENGKEAVELFSSHPEGYYDAILMDMRMYYWIVCW